MSDPKVVDLASKPRVKRVKAEMPMGSTPQGGLAVPKRKGKAAVSEVVNPVSERTKTVSARPVLPKASSIPAKIPVVGFHEIKSVGKVKIKARAPSSGGYSILHSNGDISYQEPSGVKIPLYVGGVKGPKLTDKRLIKLFKQGVVRG